MESNVESKVSMPYFKFENFNDQCFEFDTFHSRISVIILRKTKALQKEAQHFQGGKKYLKLESEEKRGQISFYYYTAELFNWPTMNNLGKYILFDLLITTNYIPDLQIFVRQKRKPKTSVFLLP